MLLLAYLRFQESKKKKTLNTLEKVARCYLWFRSDTLCCRLAVAMFLPLMMQGYDCGWWKGFTQSKSIPINQNTYTRKYIKIHRVGVLK